jgi:hypothetical protein
LQPGIKNLRQHTIFKNLCGVFLLCTFLLGVTPKYTLHNFTANHKDAPHKKTNDGFQLNAAGFNCELNSIVATSAFTETVTDIRMPVLVHLNAFIELFSSPLLPTAHIYFELRGPPSLV